MSFGHLVAVIHLGSDKAYSALKYHPCLFSLVENLW